MKIGLLILGVALLVAGCGKPKTLVGNWSTEFPLLSGAQIEFSPDQRAVLSGTASGIDAQVDIVGTYTSTEKELSLSATKVNFKGDIPAIARIFADQEAAKIEGKTVVGKLDWKSDDEVTFTPNTDDPKNPLSQTLVLKRVKP